MLPYDAVTSEPPVAAPRAAPAADTGEPVSEAATSDTGTAAPSDTPTASPSA